MLGNYPFKFDVEEFKGKRVLITGGTKGMGRSIAQRFAFSGALVAMTARSDVPSDFAGALFVQADIGSSAGVQKVVDEVQLKWSGLDVLVNCVGGSEAPIGGVQALTDEDGPRAINVNLMAAVRFNRA